MPEPVRESRCPVCNPIHNARIVLPKTKKLRARKGCSFCNNTRMVPVQKAKLYLEALCTPPPSPIPINAHNVACWRPRERTY